MKKWAIRFGITAIAGLGCGVAALIAARPCRGDFCPMYYIFGLLSIGLLSVGVLGLIGAGIVYVVRSPRTGRARMDRVTRVLTIAFGGLLLCALILACFPEFREWSAEIPLGLGGVGALGLLGVWAAYLVRSPRTGPVAKRLAIAFGVAPLIAVISLLTPWRLVLVYIAPGLAAIGILGLLGVWVVPVVLSPTTNRAMKALAISLPVVLTIFASYAVFKAVEKSRLRARWTTYTTADGLADNKVFSIAVDPDGALWLGTDGGVSRFDGEMWTTYTKDHGLAHNDVHSIAVARDGALWFGTWGGGISRFDGEAWTTYTETDGLVDNHVNAITAAPDAALWFGTPKGVSSFDGEVWATYTTDNGLAYDNVHAIALDPDGALWFGTGHFISRFDGQDWTTYPMFRVVNAIAMGPDGAVWFGTHEDALRFDGTSWTTYTTRNGLAGNRVLSIAVAPDGALWFGTEGAGVCRFDGKTWTTFTTRNGLADNDINAIAVAPDGALWFGTDIGVSRYLPPE